VMAWLFAEKRGGRADEGDEASWVAGLGGRDL
jgi:hypothetical protein